MGQRLCRHGDLRALREVSKKLLYAVIGRRDLEDSNPAVTQVLDFAVRNRND